MHPDPIPQSLKSPRNRSDLFFISSHLVVLRCISIESLKIPSSTSKLATLRPQSGTFTMSSTTTEINAAAGEPALALPARSPPPNNWTPVWTVQPSEPLPRASREQQLSSILGDAGPLSEKCEVTERPGQPCCKDLKGEDERHLLSPEVVRDM